METQFFAALVYGLVRVLDTIAFRRTSNLLGYNGLDELSYVGKCDAASKKQVIMQAKTEHVAGAPTYGIS